MKGRIGGRLILISFFFALLTCASLYWYLQGMSANTAAGSLEEIVVVKQAVSANREVRAEYLEVKRMPEEYIPPSAVRSVSQAVGKVTVSPLAPGEILSTSHLTKDKAEGGLAFLVPQGHRAMSVAVDEVTGVAELIRPGNYVDVLIFLDKEMVGNYTEGTLLQKKLVLAVDQKLQEPSAADSGKKKEKVRTVTLAVTPAEAQKLGLGQEIGSVRLVLRPQEDAATFQGKGTVPGELLLPQAATPAAPAAPATP